MGSTGESRPGIVARGRGGERGEREGLFFCCSLGEINGGSRMVSLPPWSLFSGKAFPESGRRRLLHHTGLCRPGLRGHLHRGQVRGHGAGRAAQLLPPTRVSGKGCWLRHPCSTRDLAGMGCFRVGDGAFHWRQLGPVTPRHAGMKSGGRGVEEGWRVSVCTHGCTNG